MRTADSTSPTTWNRYAYVASDPVNLIDPGGRFQCNPEVCGQQQQEDPCGADPTLLGCDPTAYAPGRTNYFGSTDPGGGGGGTILDSFAGFWPAFSLAMSALGTPDCASQFGLAANSMNPSTLLADAVTGILTGTTTELTFGTENIAGTGANTSGLGITVATNDTWAYSNANGQQVESTRASININIASWNSETTIQRAQTLIHELGHVFDMLLGAGGSVFVYDAKPDWTPDMDAEATNAKFVQNCIHN